MLCGVRRVKDSGVVFNLQLTQLREDAFNVSSGEHNIRHSTVQSCNVNERHVLHYTE